MVDRKKVLLAYGKEPLSDAVAEALRKDGFQVTSSPLKSENDHLGKERYDYLVQLGSEPRSLTEGTRHLLEKAKSEGSTFLLVSSMEVGTKPPAGKKNSYIEALHFAEALTQEFHQQHTANTITLRFPFLYGPEIPLQDSGPLGELLSEFVADQVDSSQEPILTVYGDGKDARNYLYLTDAAEAIKTALTSGKEGTVYHALPPSTTTSAALATMLKEMGGNRHEIRYHRGLTPLGEEVKLEGKKLPNFEAQTPLDKGITETLKSLIPKEETPQKKGQGVRLKMKIPNTRLQKRLIQAAIILLILSPILYAGGRAAFAVYHISQLRSQMTAFDFQAANQSATEAEKHTAALGRFFDGIPFSGKIGFLRSLAAISRGGAEALGALEQITAEGETIITTIENLLQSYQGEEIEGQTEEEFNRLAGALGEAEGRLLTSWVYLSNSNILPEKWSTSLFDYLRQGINALKLGEALSSAAPDLLGYHGERNYLILLQNSAEIRASGGFLGSLAQVTLENGGIKTLEIFDSYQFDSVGGLPAPDSAKKFLEVEELNLRESNFFASFPEGAQRIGQLFEEGQGVQIDGIVGLNLLFVEEFIALSGPLELSEFEQTITAENLFEVTTEEVEKDFFPGSTKKKRFLQALGEELINKLFSLEKDYYGRLALIGWDGLKKRNLLLFLQKNGLVQTLIETGFDGRTKDTSKDFLSVIDSNYGNKANIWIERKIDYKIFNVDREDNLQGALTVAWTHQGTEAWPSGTYGNLFRVLVPQGSILTEATLNEEDYLSEMLTTEEAGKTEFATSLQVEPQATVTLELNYRFPTAFNLKELEDYQLYVQKQPGTIADAFTFTFEEPLGKRIYEDETSLRPEDATVVQKADLQCEDNSLMFEGDLERDLVIDIVIEEE